MASTAETQANPSNLDKTFLDFNFKHGGGVLVPVEIGWSPVLGAKQLVGSYKIGARYTNAGDVFLDVNRQPRAITGLEPLEHNSRYGVWINAWQQVLGKSENGKPRSRATLISAISLLTAGCGGVLDPVGPVGAQEKQILVNSTAIMLAIVIPVMIATVAFAWWFRRGNKKARYLPDWEYSGAIELVVWSIPAMTVMLLGGIAWIGSHDLEPSRPLKSSAPPLRVDVVSLDWKWLFIYPDQGIATVNQLVVPTGVPVSYRLTSATVWNSFFVPRMGTMIYTMPRMTTRLNLQADRPGVYDGLSSHYSGEGFSGMRFKVHAIPPQQFAAWAQGARGKGSPLDGRSYAELAKPSSYVGPATYGAVAPGLFDSIVADRAPRSQVRHTEPPSRQAPATPSEV